jgi:hypothetical protein
MRMKNKKKRAAMEMSVGTLVTIVLLLSVLILGLFLTRKIMCAGITITDEIDTRVKNEIKSLFGSDDYGIKCMGEGTEDVKLGDGGRRKIFCVANLKEEKNIDTDTVQGHVMYLDITHVGAVVSAVC